MTARVLTRHAQTAVDDVTQWDAQSQAPYWLDVSNPTRDLLTQLGLHPLVIEDIVHGGQRTKVEYYDEYLFFVFYTFGLQNADTLEVDSIPLYICVSNHKIITIHQGCR